MAMAAEWINSSTPGPTGKVIDLTCLACLTAA